MSDTTTEPLAVYDVHSKSWPPPNLDRFLWWMGEQGIDEKVTYRIEIYSTDHWFARVFQHDRNEDGRPYLRDGELACRDPFDVPIKEMPPTRGAA
jgi:hypothetical protein